ncbi:MAG: bacteriocin [Clostridia bacterium]|nr:bacteriocin [Clostridia bacterium]
MKNKNELNEKELSEVTGGALGMSNPVSGITREQAEAMARELGLGKDMGSWRTMSSEDFMAWWRASNNQPLRDENTAELNENQLGMVSAGASEEEYPSPTLPEEDGMKPNGKSPKEAERSENCSNFL